MITEIAGEGREDVHNRDLAYLNSIISSLRQDKSNLIIEVESLRHQIKNLQKIIDGPGGG